MYRLRIYFITLFIILLSLHDSSAQQRTVDSLLSLIKKDKEDTLKVSHLNELGWRLMNINPDSAIIPLTQALALAEKIKWVTGQSVAYSNLGTCNYTKGDYPLALGFYLKAINSFEKLGNKTGFARNLSNVGNIYYLQGDYRKALDYYSRALKISEDLYAHAKKRNDQPAIHACENVISTHVGNIGNVYNVLGAIATNADSSIALFEKALEYYFRTLKMEQENLEHAKRSGYEAQLRENKNGIAIWLANIGAVYACQGQFAAAGKTKEELFSKALNYYTQALQQYREVENKNGIADQLSNIGQLYGQTGKYSEAEEHLVSALKLIREIGARNDERQIEEKLTGLYQKTGNYNLALQHYRRAMMLKDSLFNEEKNNEITRKEMNYEFEKKQAAEKAEHDKQLAVAAADKKRQRLFLWFTAIGLFFAVIVALFIFRSLRLTRKQKQVIEDQKVIVEKQKQLVEVKQKEILDSIHYAKRIQQALITNEKYIERSLNSKMEKTSKEA